jgi:hypothetical protein
MNDIITICIPTFNQAAFLPKAVQSALGQEDDITLWVSDDASTDDASDRMREFENDSRVRYVRQPRNLGIAANVKWLLSQPDSEYIIRLDSDDLLLPGYAARLRELLEANPSAGVAHCAVKEIDQFGRYRRLRRLHRTSGYEDAETALRAAGGGYKVAANICMFRRSALDGLDILREGHNFAEDWDLWIRLADAGWGNVYLDEPLACYRVWTDKKGVRAKRKVSELIGCRRVFEESLEPAFIRRGWDTSHLEQRRQELAASHAGALAENPTLTANEREDIITALKSLGDGQPLEKMLKAIEDGRGPLIIAKRKLHSFARDTAKTALRLLRRR